MVEIQGQETQQDQSQQNDTFAPGAHARGAHMPVRNILDSFNVIHNLPEEVKKYRDRVEEDLKRYNLTITRFELNSPNGTMVFVCKEYAIIVMFDELLMQPQRTQYAPKSINIQQALEELMRDETLKNKRILNSVIVHPEDYNKSGVMAQYIGSVFLERTGMSNLDASMFTGQNVTYMVNTDIQNAKQDIDRIYPHKTLPPMDIGLTIALKHPGRDQFAREGTIDPYYPVVALSAFTEFVQVQMGDRIKYQPIVRITNIAPIAPIPALTFIALFLAAEHLCKNNGWVKPYYQLSTLKGKAASGQPNIGNLAGPDPSDANRLFECKSVADVDGVVNIHCNHAILAVDIVDGDVRPPVLSAFMNPHEKDMIEKYLSQFFLNGNPVQVPNIVYSMKKEFVGKYGDMGSRRDTRSLTYLDVVSKYGAGRDEIRQLLQWTSPAGPSHHASLIDQLIGGFVSESVATTVILDPEFIKAIGYCISASGIQLVSDEHTFTQTLGDVSGVLQGLAGIGGVTSSPSNPYNAFMTRPNHGSFF